MNRLLLFFTILFIFTTPVAAMINNREPYSPSGKYKFSLRDIQRTVRSALEKADNKILELSDQQVLHGIASLYFKDYLDSIAAYNDEVPQTFDMVEAYKTELVIAYVLKEFKDTFPKLIYDRAKWILNNVGTSFDNMIIIYCSRKEYIVIWGTTLRADNKFSGYYPFMNEFDVMIKGTMHSHDVNAPGHAAVIYKPYIENGVYMKTVDTSNLIPKNVRVYNLDNYTYMVSYAQGNMAKAFFPGAIMPGIFGNQDWAGLKTHIVDSAKAYYYSKKGEYDPEDWLNNPNYRAIWIIDQYFNNYCPMGEAP